MNNACIKKYEITDFDLKKAKSIINRINQKDKAGKDYVFTLGIGKDFSFVNDILKECDDSTVLLVASNDDIYTSSGIVFIGEYGVPLIYGSIGNGIMEYPHFIEDVNDICGGQKWCIGEIRTAESEDALEIQSESLFHAFFTFI